MATSIDQVTPKQGISVGVIVAGIGLVIVLRAANIIQAGAIHAPNWVVGIAGLAFFLPGLFMVYYGIRNAYQPFRLAPRRDPGQLSFGGWILVGLLTTGLGLIGAWVALGPGARQFQGGITGSAIEGRIVFGIGAVITLSVAALVWVNGFRQFLGGRKASTSSALQRRPPPPRIPRR